MGVKGVVSLWKYIQVVHTYILASGEGLGYNKGMILKQVFNAGKVFTSPQGDM